ncbi:protein of unknown function [Paraburkholderia dioscoreae]|uniref:Uncharacterized protein n=1 Tax=Paraburkholderia dioscoreae TaxID=2604047 RepID=A0A5Q4ZJF6_9BURK|nr:protein of unknown function [Paraburkholderia dioscoreae]
MNKGGKSRLLAQKSPGEESTRDATNTEQDHQQTGERKVDCWLVGEKVQGVAEDGEHRGVLQSYRREGDPYDTRKPDRGRQLGYCRMTRASAAMSEHHPYADGCREVGSGNERDWLRKLRREPGRHRQSEYKTK